MEQFNVALHYHQNLPRPWSDATCERIASVLCNIGSVYNKQNLESRALEETLKALKVHEKLLDDYDSNDVATITNNIGIFRCISFLCAYIVCIGN